MIDNASVNRLSRGRTYLVERAAPGLRNEVETAEGDAAETDAAEQGDADAEEVGWVAHSPSQAELDPGTPWEADEPVEEEADEDDKAAPTEEAQEGSFGSI